MIQDRNAECGRRESDLLLLLYGEMEPASRRDLEAHARACDGCASSLAVFGKTLQTVDDARLVEMATLEAPGSWPELRAALAASPLPALSARRPAWPVLARAAAVLLVAGASFGVGRWWDQGQAGGPVSGEIGPDRTGGLDSAGRVALFSQRTNDYLDRSRMVLLELANGDLGDERYSLSRASQALLQENAVAREVARDIADRRLQQLVDELETILGQISRLQGAGTGQADRIRTYVNNSGVLEQLEVLSLAPQKLATRRRT